MMVSDFWIFTLNCLEKLASSVFTTKTYTFKPFLAFFSRVYADVTTLIIFLSPGLLGSEVGFDLGSLEIILMYSLALFISWFVMDKVFVSFLNISPLDPKITVRSTKYKNDKLTFPAMINNENEDLSKFAVSSYKCQTVENISPEKEDNIYEFLLKQTGEFNSLRVGSVISSLERGSLRLQNRTNKIMAKGRRKKRAWSP